ncbi:hypothetical protein [Neorhizobium sp. NCHU2750]|uniref:hypothetical protein n=1 Tax=Neorhizobium sp. NCHU2750 TaxID=1825976 RepID=UPI000E71B360
MKEYGSLAPCTYRQAIVRLELDEEAPDGFDVVTLNARGETLRGPRALLPGKRYRIAVSRDFYRSISDATRKLREQLEPILFTTRETVNFNLDLRVRTEGRHSAEIARRHFHESKGPEQLFYAFFGNEFRALLEQSARQQTGDIDRRIDENKEKWEPLLAEKLEARFGLGFEINFLIDKTVEQDKQIATEGAAPLHVAFVDRIDKDMPLRVDLRIRRHPVSKSNLALPRGETKLRNVLLEVIRKACAEELTLFDYWYRPAQMRQAIATRLAAYLDEYSYGVANLVVVRDEASRNPPPQSVKLEASVRWQDTRGYELEFRADAVARIAEDGAGLYDRSEQPERAAWFRATIADCLSQVLAGVAINDLGETQIAAYNDEVRQRISDRADGIGLKLDVFFASVFLPLHGWLKTRRVTVPEQDYRTAHPRIPGTFAMDMELRFETRAALEPFFIEYARQNGGQNSRVPDDDFIREKLAAAAREAAELVMQSTPAEIYFSNFIGAARWNASMSESPDPGFGGVDNNLISAKLVSILENRYPGVTLVALHFHRIDRCVEDLRRLVAAVRTVQFECVIKDRLFGDGGRDRNIKGYVIIEGGSAERIVMMLNNDLHLIAPDRFKADLIQRLRVAVENRLSHATKSELESLMNSMTAEGGAFINPVSRLLKEHLRAVLETGFGLIVGDIEFTAELSAGEENLREFSNSAMRVSLGTLKDEYLSLERQFNNLLEQRQAIIGTSVEDNKRRSDLTGEIEKTRAAIQSLRERASGGKLRDPADVVIEASHYYLAQAVPLALPSSVVGPDGHRSLPDDKGGSGGEPTDEGF